MVNKPTGQINDGRVVVQILSSKDYKTYKKQQKSAKDVSIMTQAQNMRGDKQEVEIDAKGTSRWQALAQLKDKNGNRLLTEADIQAIEKAYIELKQQETQQTKGKNAHYKDKQNNGEVFDMTAAFEAANLGYKLQELPGEMLPPDSPQQKDETAATPPKSGDTPAEQTAKDTPAETPTTPAQAEDEPTIDQSKNFFATPQTEVTESGKNPFAQVSADPPLAPTTEESPLIGEKTGNPAAEAPVEESEPTPPQTTETQSAEEQPAPVSTPQAPVVSFTPTNGKEEKITNEDGSYVITSYGNYGKEGSNGPTSRTAYSADGRITQETQYGQNSEITSVGNYQYNDKGQLTSVVTSDADGNLISTQAFTYNKSGTKTGYTTKDAQNRTIATGKYDKKGNLTSESQITYTGNKKSVATTDYQYDKQGHLTGKQFKDPTTRISTTYAYNKAGQKIGENSKTVDRKTGKTVAQTSLAYTYDDQGRLATTTNKVTKQNTEYQYDENGNLACVINNNGQIERSRTTYTAEGYEVSTRVGTGREIERFDNNNKLIGKSECNSDGTVRKDLEYDGRDTLISSTTYGYKDGKLAYSDTYFEADDANPKSIGREYDENGKVTKTTIQADYDGIVYQTKIEKDQNDNVISHQQGIALTTYEYNDNNELVSSIHKPGYLDLDPSYTKTEYSNGKPVKANSYDKDEKLVEETSFDENGTVTGSVAYEYTNGRLSAKSIKDAEGHVTLTDHLDENGKITTYDQFTYDNGKLSTAQTFDNYNRILSSKNYDASSPEPRKTTTYTYDEFELRPATEKIVLRNGNTRETVFDYDAHTERISENGVLTAVRNTENGTCATYAYNEDKSYTVTTTNADGKPIEIISKDANNALVSREVLDYNEQGELTQSQKFDSSNALVSTAVPTFGNGGVKVKDAITTADGEQYDLYYTPEGKPDYKVTQEPNGIVSTEYYDGTDKPVRMVETENGRTTQEVVYGANDNTYEQIIYQYDPNDPTKITGYLQRSVADDEVTKLSTLDANKNLMSYQTIDKIDYTDNGSITYMTSYDANGTKTGATKETFDNTNHTTNTEEFDTNGLPTSAKLVQATESGSPRVLSETAFKNGQLDTTTVYTHSADTNIDSTTVYDSQNRCISFVERDAETNDIVSNTSYKYQDNSTMPIERISTYADGLTLIERTNGLDGADYKVLVREEYKGETLVHRTSKDASNAGTETFFGANNQPLVVQEKTPDAKLVRETFKDDKGEDAIVISYHPSGKPSEIISYSAPDNGAFTIMDQDGNIIEEGTIVQGKRTTTAKYTANGEFVYINEDPLTPEEFAHINDAVQATLAQRWIHPRTTNLAHTGAAIIKQIQGTPNPEALATLIYNSCLYGSATAEQVHRLNRILKENGINCDNPIEYIAEHYMTPEQRYNTYYQLGQKGVPYFAAKAKSIEGTYQQAQQRATEIANTLYTASEGWGTDEDAFHSGINNIQNAQELTDVNAVLLMRGTTVDTLIDEEFSGDEYRGLIAQTGNLTKTPGPALDTSYQRGIVAQKRSDLLLSVNNYRTNAINTIPEGINTDSLAHVQLN